MRKGKKWIKKTNEIFFSQVVLSVLVAVASAKPFDLVASPVHASLIGEKTIESHGNSVVHASAPLVSSISAAPAVITSPIVAESAVAYAAPSHHQVLAHALPAASLAHEKTIESHGNSVIHASAPVYAAAVAEPAPLLYTYAAPAPVAGLVGEKTVSNYGHSVLHHGGPAIAHHTAYVAPTLVF